MKPISILLCLVLLLSLGGCYLPEEYRVVNPTGVPEWEHTAPSETTPVVETAPVTPPSVKTASQIAAEMDIPELVAQLFLVKCPAGGAAELLNEFHVGGLILYGQDIDGETPQSLREKLADYQSRVPVKLIIAVDEEGGLVNRVSTHAAFRSEPFRSVRDVYDEGGVQLVKDYETGKARFLRDLGINVNLGPICDVVTEETGFMANRAMWLTPKATAEVVAGIVKASSAGGVSAVLKHFPGYGNVPGDTHSGKVVDTRDPEAIRANDFKPFQAGIDAGVGAVMVGHSIVKHFDEEHPASLSKKVHGLLRDELKFRGVILTDDLSMGAITDGYAPGTAAVKAITSGNDMLITTWSEEQYDAICDAVKSGQISQERLVQSVERIIQWKMDLGLL